MSCTFGTVLPTSHKARVVPLWWDSCRIELGQPLKDQLDRLGDEPKLHLDEKGVYAFDGSQDGRPFGGVLYIGESGGDDGGGTLRSRIKTSSQKFLWKQGGQHGLYSDVWNVTLRWAPIGESELVLQVESLLILAHAPSFNAQQVRTNPRASALDLVILNGGEKGPLLPTVCGHYYDPKIW